MIGSPYLERFWFYGIIILHTSGKCDHSDDSEKAPVVNASLAELRNNLTEKILAKQDSSFRWGYDQHQAVERPQYLYYSPNFKSTLWTLVTLAEIKAPVDDSSIQSSLKLVNEHFFLPEHGIFGFPDLSFFPIPCLNGNLIYVNSYFETFDSDQVDRTIAFFAAHQRFDDGDFKTPDAYPYRSNTSCYGKHTCYWGIIKLFKGISSIPSTMRSQSAQSLIEKCIEFVLQHEVLFGSHHPDRFLHRDIAALTFPNFYHSDFLEILWLLKREKVYDRRLTRALELLRSKKQDDGNWVLEKSLNTIIPLGQKGVANAFITERAIEVL